MSYFCEVCGKRTISGGSIIRKGLAKKIGGIGTHIVKNNKRTFKPNIQTIKFKVDGKTKSMKICTSCLRAGKYKK